MNLSEKYQKLNYMTLQQLRFVFIITSLLLFLSSSFLKGQIAVEFTGTPTIGCAPLNVVFTNLSSKSPNLSYSWEFGDGSTSTAENPQTTYHTAGEFTVKLTVTDEISSYSTTKEAYIKVGEKPTAYFTYNGPSEDCIPFLTTFKNESSDSSESDLTYTWSFGDGERSLEEQPEHTYNTAGVYNVTLVAKNSYCQDSYTLNQTIEAVKPQAVFGVSNNESCSGQLNAVFSNLSNARSNFSSQWSFGDGAISQDQNPPHLYTQPGEYSVQLKVTDDLGCTDSVKHNNLIKITEIESDFQVSTIKGCINEKIKFTNLSKNASNYLWHFDDGTSSTQANPEKKYTQPGNYTVKLIAKGGSCTAEKEMLIHIEEAVAQFTVSDNYICQLPAS
ncbi:MAG TPA: PKD domain-containing protein, partial [Marinilabiliaceae bacterium]|nr:PKD domain-containing protein [Marinilabiliaceae bacterium]